AVRWWLLREVPRVGDADFTTGRLVARADDELANGLGNLVNRVVSMIGKYRAGRVPAPAAAEAGGAALAAVAGPVAPAAIAGSERLAAACREAHAAAGAALEDFDFRRATAAVWRIADEANAFVNLARPWELARAEAGPAQGDGPDQGDKPDQDKRGRRDAREQLDAVLGQLLGACSVLGRELAPFVPDLAARVTAQCAPGGDGRLPVPRPVFRRLSAPSWPAPARSAPAGSAPAARLRVEEPEQDQQDDGADDRPDDPDRVEAVDAQVVVLDQVLQEAAHERAHDAEHDGAEDSDGIAAGDQQPGDGTGDEADDDEHDNESDHAGKLPRSRVLCPRGRIVMKPVLARQLALERGAEPGGDPDPGVLPDPLAQPSGLRVESRRGLGTGVLEQPQRDPAVLALRPAAH